MGETPVNIVSYQGPLTRLGVTVARRGDGYIVITLPSRYYLPLSPKTVSLSGCGLLAFAFVVRLFSDSMPAQVAGNVLSLAGFVLMVSIVLARPSMITIKDGMLRVRYPRSHNHQHVPMSAVPVGSIYRIHYVNHANAIFVRATGHEMLEITLHYPEPAVIALTQLLNELIFGEQPDDLSNPDSPV